MIFLDANVFLRFLAPSISPNTEAMQRAAALLFAAIARGEEDATTSEVVLHEVAYVLGSKAHYQLPVPEIASALRQVLQMPGIKLPRGDKKVYLRALEIYLANPKLEIADSIIAARAERLGVPLATFDERLGNLSIITRWQPTDPSS